MGQVLDFIKGVFFRKEKESKANAEELRVDFRGMPKNSVWISGPGIINSNSF